MQRKITLAGLILITIALALLALTDPLVRVLIFGVRGFSGQLPSGFRQFNSTFRQTFSSATTLQLRAYILAFISFGAAVIGLILAYLGIFVSRVQNR
ncbi:MAG: hypothetical protein QXV32_09045 [Conexivisphaerales archaeon]